MKGSVNAAELAAAVKTAQSIIPGGTPIPALGHVRLTAVGGTLEIEATNLNQHMAVRLPTSLSDGCAIAEPARLLTALAPISGEASIAVTDTIMSVSGKGARSRLTLLPQEDWASIQKPSAEASFDINGESLAAAFETVMPAADDASRFYLYGAHLKWVGTSLIAEATNGKIVLTREIVARRPAMWPEDSVIVPREFMIAASKMGRAEGVTLSVSSNRIILTAPAGWIASKLIAGSFPIIERSWDKDAAPALRADRKSLASVVKLAHQFSEADGSNQRILVIHGGEVLAAGPNGEMFRATFDGEYIKEQTYCFQPRFLLTALSALTSETVEMTDGGKFPNVTVIHGDGARTCAVLQIGAPAWWLREQAAGKREAA